MSFVPLHVHSHYSLLNGLSRTTSIAERCAELKYGACALTDHGNIAGTISFVKALDDVCHCGHQKTIHQDKKKCTFKGCPCVEHTPYKVKPILGSEFNLCTPPFSAEKIRRTIILSKNLAGWKGLIKATSQANLPKNAVEGKTPSITIDGLSEYCADNWICIGGYMDSDLSECLFMDINAVYRSKSYDDAKALIHTDWKKRIIECAGKYLEIFGKENFYLGVHLLDAKRFPATEILSKTMRWLGKKLSIPCVAITNSHFSNKNDAADQRILLCIKNKKTLKKIHADGDLNENDVVCHFRSNNYHIPSLEELQEIHEPEEIANTLRIAEKCESYKVLGKPQMPDFVCPNGLTSDDYLKKLCARGWKNKIDNVISDSEKDTYKQRIKHELDVICGAGLSPYFLVVQDYCNWARRQGWLLGPGRGSGAGCLISYLIGITSVNPIPANLIFERFYNAGRNTADRIAFPDIDSDFPKFKRPHVIAYIKKKYGEDKVSQMITFTTLKGRSALTEVLSVHETMPFADIKKISKLIPQDASISDHLQNMREARGEASTIRWALENIPESLRDWCFINENDEFDGQYAKLFEQAVRIEGLKKNPGKHASGIIISKEPLAEVCPMWYDTKDGNAVAGMEMGDLEASGHTKFDILGVSMFDKAMFVQEQIVHGGRYE